MRPARNVWPDTEGARGALFFAQLVVEQLSDGTFESFRAMTMDTLSRLDEATTLASDVQRNMAPPKVLEPAIEEVRWSLNQDPVAKKIAPNEVATFLGLATKMVDPMQLSQLLSFLRKRLAPAYGAALEDEILEAFSDSSRRKDLRVATSFYCSHLINAGFSKEFVLDEVESRFFSSTIARVRKESIAAFFRRFPTREWRYDVFVPVQENFGKYLASLNLTVRRARSIAAHVRLGLGVAVVPANAWVFVHRVDAKDEFSAARLTEQRLSSMQALAMLAPKTMDCIWAKTMYVNRMRAEAGRLITSQQVSFHQGTVASLSGRSMRSLKKHTERILTSFDDLSTDRFLSSVNTNALARSSANLENALISIWSSVEVMLSVPPVNVPRIVHYETLLVPCVIYRYPRRQFAAVYDELMVSYRRSFLRIVEKVFPDELIDIHSKFVFLLLLPEFQPLRDELTVLLQKNPLALHRTGKLIRDFGTAESLTKTLQHHEKRVRWQLHRIYRARNHLVHSGRVPPYLAGLVTNAYEYYRSAIASIVSHARLDTEESSLDQVVAEIGFEYEICKKAAAKGPEGGLRAYLEKVALTKA